MEKELFVPTVLWVGFLASNFIYAALPHLVAIQGIQLEPSVLFPDFKNPIELAFGFIALGMIGASFFAPRIIAKASQVKVNSEMPLQTIVQHGFTPFIIEMALREGAGVLGIALMMQTKMAGKVFPFVLLSFIFLLRSKPTKEKLLAYFA